MKKFLLLILAAAFSMNLIAQEQTTDTIVSENSSLPTIIMIDTDYDDAQSSTDISSFLQS